ncbi:MAG TPA: ATP synthase F0 subunit C [Candidatus Gallimonas intestinigallinarum]|uniref:ATP synthase subunit c n=1 Tax=Candidatus Gallimonas intestinigallinarum TaxID=2838604 RepID=A0A9D2DX12_9FIRM|nr:ATP synthase F0 subunit C [Candidatus Gallimonas intestinigallinarum]
MSDTHESFPANDVVAVSAEAVEDTNPAAETEAAEADSTGAKAIAAGIAIGLAAAAGAVGMGIAIAKSNEAISRQPEADGKIRSTLMLGLILIETAIIYALVIAILIIFAL